MNLNQKGFTSIEIFGIIAIFSVVYIVGLVNYSYAFNVDYEQEAYEQTLSLIEMQSELYASLNEELFEDSTIIYLYVSDLIENNFISVDEEGNLVDPTNENSNLNNLKIKVILTDGEYVASVVEI